MSSEQLQHPPDMPGFGSIYPSYGIVTFGIHQGSGDRGSPKIVMVTRMVDMRVKEEVLAFLDRNKDGIGIPILNVGEFENFYSNCLPRNKVLKILKNILEEINNGRITVRGNKNAQREV